MKGSDLPKLVLELGKARISLPVALSALAGYVLLEGTVGLGGWLLAAGVFSMSAGSATLNHLQEYRLDALMPRTQNRPLPSGRISVKGAWLVALGWLVAGSLLLLAVHPPLALLLSWMTLLCYNAIYTPLKKVTAFAVIPGSMVGALPPMIGWAAAGGNLLDNQILLVATFFFIGQIPHFWLLLLIFGDQYQLAGLPSLNRIFSPAQIKRITFTWILTTVASALLVLFYVISNSILFFVLLIYVFYLLFSLTFRFLLQPEFYPRPAFFRLNLLYLFMMFFIIAEGLLRSPA
ncbi:MAG TPA: protoheme IX farnesyltransferase [Prolixibacteraceae bacterium]|nr:protoheme IX farnesyltransferase [Prolixibacteraceae bacterium]